MEKGRGGYTRYRRYKKMTQKRRKLFTNLFSRKPLLSTTWATNVKRARRPQSSTMSCTGIAPLMKGSAFIVYKDTSGDFTYTADNFQHSSTITQRGAMTFLRYINSTVIPTKI